jgi:hypothetical protein
MIVLRIPSIEQTSRPLDFALREVPCFAEPAARHNAASPELLRLQRSHAREMLVR